MTTMNRIPLYLIALIVAIANSPLNIYDVHAWNAGTVHVEPWRTKVSTAGLCRRLHSGARAIFEALWGHRQAIAVATLLLCLVLLAPHTPGVSICAVGSIAQLTEQFEEAKEQVRTYQSRGVDPDTMTAALEKAKAIKAKLDRARGDANQMAEIERITSGMSPSRGGGRSLGAAFVNSDTFKWLEKNKGRLPTGAWTSPASELNAPELMATTIDESGGSGGGLLIPQYLPGVLPLPQRPLRVADLLAQGQADSGSVIYMQETTFTNAASAVAEGTTKPESTLAFAAVTELVRKIAHWIPVTEEMLEDVAAIRSYLDARLVLGVGIAEDDQLLNGSGVAPNLKGILQRAGLSAAQPRGGDSNIDAVLKQITAIQAAVFMRPDGIVMHPTNWQTILLTKDSQGRYYGDSPFSTSAASPLWAQPVMATPTPTLWGLPVAITPQIAVGTALVGAFRSQAQLFRRGALRVEASNSHSDFFVKNLIAVRAETRLALSVYRPLAFGTVTSLT